LIEVVLTVVADVGRGDLTAPNGLSFNGDVAVGLAVAEDVVLTVVVVVVRVVADEVVRGAAVVFGRVFAAKVVVFVEETVVGRVRFL
jgi:hypothetical protein